MTFQDEILDRVNMINSHIDYLSSEIINIGDSIERISEMVDSIQMLIEQNKPNVGSVCYEFESSVPELPAAIIYNQKTGEVYPPGQGPKSFICSLEEWIKNRLNRSQS